MKTKVFSLLVFFCLQSSISAHAVIKYRRASVDDAPRILQIYRNFSDEDSLLKLYVIPNEQVDGEIQGELRCVGKGREKRVDVLFDFRLVEAREQFLRSEEGRGLPLLDDFELQSDRQWFVYYGGAYVIPEKRNQKIHTCLLFEALKLLQNEIRTKFQEKSSSTSQLIFAYGQVEANIARKGMIHLFAQFVHGLVTSPQSHLALADNQVRHLGYKTFKPTFTYNKQTQQLNRPEFPESAEGLGNLVIFNLNRSDMGS